MTLDRSTSTGLSPSTRSRSGNAHQRHKSRNLVSASVFLVAPANPTLGASGVLGAAAMFTHFFPGAGQGMTEQTLFSVPRDAPAFRDKSRESAECC